MCNHDRLDIRKDGETLLLRFGGYRVLDGRTADELREQLHSAADRSDCRQLVLDFSGVEYASTTMLQELLSLRKKMLAKGGALTLIHVDSFVREVLVATKLNQVFDIERGRFDVCSAMV